MLSLLRRLQDLDLVHVVATTRKSMDVSIPIMTLCMCWQLHMQVGSGWHCPATEYNAHVCTHFVQMQLHMQLEAHVGIDRTFALLIMCSYCKP